MDLIDLLYCEVSLSKNEGGKRNRVLCLRSAARLACRVLVISRVNSS